jgi:hypothetical protein
MVHINTLDVSTIDFKISPERQDAPVERGILGTENDFSWCEDPAGAPVNRMEEAWAVMSSFGIRGSLLFDARSTCPRMGPVGPGTGSGVGSGAIAAPARRLLLLVVVSMLATVLAAGCSEPEGGPEADGSHPAATTSVEDEIREADQLEIQAILQGDPELQERIWDEDFVVTNVVGEVFTRTQVIAVFQEGVTPYRSFERETERIRLYGEAAVSQGSERVVPAEAPADATPTLRRYTHVWVDRDGEWRLAVRHAGRVPREGASP